MDRGRRAEPDDSGFSLVELMVTMGIMTILLGIVTTAFLQVFRTTSAAQSLSTAQSQLQIAFQRFDRELRYASWIAVPGKVGTTWYVEFAGVDPTDCSQLRLEAPVTASAADAGGVLQLLQWTRGAPPAAGTRGQTLASTVVTGGADAPFALQAPGLMPFANPTGDAVGGDFAPDFQRLRIRLTTQVGRTTTGIDTTFTALNTSRNTSTTNGCSEGRPTA